MRICTKVARTLLAVLFLLLQVNIILLREAEAEAEAEAQFLNIEIVQIHFSEIRFLDLF